MTSTTDEMTGGVRNKVQMFDGKGWVDTVLEDVWPPMKIRLFEGDTGDAIVDPDNETSTEWTVTGYPTKSGGIWTVPVEPIVE